MADRSDHPHYEILELCGTGGNGIVYRARDKRLNRIVALKFLLANHGAALTRFRHEAEAIAALNHPAIATIFEAGEWEGEPYLALEYLPGGTLAKAGLPGGLPPALILEYVRQIGSGLQYAHSKGILHRDVKPSNCMFSAHGSLKLVDFGLAKSASADEQTLPGIAVGTVPYMAPELLLGEGASVQSDLYALGVLVYELAAGQPMFRKSQTASLSDQVLSGSAVPLAQLRPDLPPIFLDAVKRATSPRAGDRFSSVSDFLGALTGSGSQASGISECTETLSRVAVLDHRWKGRWRLLLVAVGLAFAAFLIFRFVSARSASNSQMETLLVLPFENLGDDPANQSLCDGLQETATSILSSATELKQHFVIVPSSEVRKREIRTIAEARKQFNATLALNGTAHSTAKQIQLTFNITDARRMREKDSRVVSVALDQTAGLQALLAENLGALLIGRRLTINSGSQGGTTANSEAYSLLVRGTGAMQDRNLDSAVDYFTRALEIDPSFVAAHAKLAELYLRRHGLTKDLKWLAMADSEIAKAAQNGEDSSVLMPQGMIQRATGKTSEAIATFRKALAAEPGNIEALRFLAETLDANGQTKEAEQIFKQALKARPGYSLLYESLGDFYSKHHDFDKAIEAFNGGLSLANESYTLHYDLGATYFRMSRWDQAVTEFEKSIRLKPTAIACANLGTVRFFQGNYVEAAAQSRQAAELQPANAVNWGNLGDALWQISGKRASAQDAFRRAAELAGQKLSINPNDAQTRKSFALYLAKLGNLGEAQDQARRAIGQAPTDQTVRFYAARVFTLAERFDDALAELEKCKQLGYSAKEIREEPDFKPLRNNARFESLSEKK